MATTRPLVVFLLDDREHALPLGAVVRVVRAVEVTPLPDAPPSVLGLISVQGQVLPVLSARRRLGLPERDLALSDQFVITTNGRHLYAIVADAVLGAVDGSVDASPGDRAEASSVEGVARQDGRLILVHDPARLLSPEETELVHAVPA